MSDQFPYQIMNREELIVAINSFASLGQPFLFVIDYKAEAGYLIKEQEIDPHLIKFSIERNRLSRILDKKIEWETFPIKKEAYKTKFEYVVDQIHLGNSFLINLTQPTKLKTNLSLEDLYEFGKAKYKLWLKNQFTVLSPETFIRINGSKIFSYPMKGTIDASIPDAENIILNDLKEKSEHATIVDLIRNDLSMVAENVEVTRYRYIDRLKTNKGKLLQVSSEISGDLPRDFRTRLGEIIFTLLPAGSITGAPKPKTLQIIEKAEKYDRGFYTGVFGFFDGGNLDSAVMIRFVEQQGNNLVFKSGGGITSQSDMEKEYNELIQKVYVPVH